MPASKRISDDPYLRCEDGCTHDLAQGVLVEDLLGGDGPHPAIWAQSATGGWLLGWQVRTRLQQTRPAA